MGFMKEGDVAALQARDTGGARVASGSFGVGGLDAMAMAAWAVVGIPIACGVWNTLSEALTLSRR